MAGETGASTIDCVRCSRTAAPAQGVFYGGELGETIRTRVCSECWDEWKEAEVKVINELRLNFMDPESQKTLERQLREFLALDTGAAD